LAAINGKNKMSLKLWKIEFDAAHPDEFTGCTIIQSAKEPTEDLVKEVVPIHGAIFINKITEATEEDIRNINPKRVIYLDR